MQLDGENPWPGLASFEEDAHDFFHGRSREAASLLDQVVDAPAVVLYGRSGLGKTSLLQAGLFPLLRDRGFLPVYIRLDFKPGVAPLTDQLRQSVHDAIRAEVPDAPATSDSESLWEYLHRGDFELWSPRNYPLTPVIVLDQFEELFTLGERVAGPVRDFRNDLGDLIENRIPTDLVARVEHDEALAARFQLRARNYKVLISLREDFLPELEGWRRLIPALGRSRIRLLPLSAEEALDAVRKPAADLMTDELARQVVRIVAGEDAPGHSEAWEDTDGLENEVGSAEVEPALLSLFCRELNEERKRLGQKHFDEKLVDEGRRDTLSNYYSSCVSDLSPGVAHFIESELITEKGFRNSFAREDAVPSRVTEDELARLIRSRLLRLEERHGAQRIELTHDVLTSVVREHRDSRRAREQAEKQASDAAERQYASLRQRLERRRVALLALTAVVAIVAVIAAGLAFVQSRRAMDEARNALAAKLDTDAAAVLSRITAGSDVRALAATLAAKQLRKDSTASRGALYTATAALNTTRAIVPTNAPVHAVVFSPVGTALASAGSDHTIQLWTLPASGRLTASGVRLAGHTDGVDSLAFSPDGRTLASGGRDHRVLLWDIRTGKPLGPPLTGHTGTVSSVAFSPDGRILASASTDQTVRLWNVAEPSHPQPLGDPVTGYADAVTGVAFSPDGRVLASSSLDHTVQLVDLTDPAHAFWLGEALSRNGDPNTFTALWSVAFSPDGHTVAAGGANNSLSLWDVTDPAHPGPPVDIQGSGGSQDSNFGNTVTSLAFSPDGRNLAVGNLDTTVQVWDVTDPTKPLASGVPLTGQTRTVSSVAFSPDGRTLASGSFDSTVRLWNLNTALTAGARDQRVESVAFSPDGRRFASANDNKNGIPGGTDNPDNKTVRLWSFADPAHPVPLGTPLTSDSGVVWSVAFSPDGNTLAYGGTDKTVRLWNLTDPTHPMPLGQPLSHNAMVTSVAFSPDGRILASASDDGTVRLWDLTNHARPLGVPLQGDTHEVWSVAFDPRGHVLAVGGADDTVRLWNLSDPAHPFRLGVQLTGHVETSSIGPSTTVTSVAFSPDGQILAFGGLSTTVELWNVSDPTHPRSLGGPLIGHTGAVWSVSFDPQGRTLASAGQDKAVRLWDLTDPAHPVTLGQPLKGHLAAVNTVAFSPDGHMLASGGDDATVRLWATPLDATVATLCSKLVSNISIKEWDEWISPSIAYVTLCRDLPEPGN
jgi:WD40 repeat protein